MDMSPQSSSSKPRVALVGVGGWAAQHFAQLIELHDGGAVQFVGCVVIDPEAQAEKISALHARGTAIYAGLDEMLANWRGRLDLSVIPTGIGWHAPMTLAALEAGANVLVEKPLAGSESDAMKIVSASRQHRRFVAVAYQDFYQPGALALKQALSSGAIGAVRKIGFLGLWPRGDAYYQRNVWAGRLADQGRAVLDSPLNNAFAHHVNLCLYFAEPARDGFATVRTVTGELWRHRPIETFDSALVSAETTGGVRLTIGVSHATHAFVEPEIRIEGTTGEAVWSANREWMVIPRNGTPVRHNLVGGKAAQREMFSAVLKRIAEPGSRICTASDARHQTEFAIRLHRELPILSVPADGSSWRNIVDVHGEQGNVPSSVLFDRKLRAAFPHLATAAEERDGSWK